MLLAGCFFFFIIIIYVMGAGRKGYNLIVLLTTFTCTTLLVCKSFLSLTSLCSLGPFCIFYPNKDFILVAITDKEGFWEILTKFSAMIILALIFSFHLPFCHCYKWVISKNILLQELSSYILKKKKFCTYPDPIWFVTISTSDLISYKASIIFMKDILKRYLPWDHAGLPRQCLVRRKLICTNL